MPKNRGGAVEFSLAATGLRQLARDAKRILDGTLEDLADMAVPRIKDPDWPVLTGLSRSGWRAEGKRIVNDVDYADYVHDGLARRLVPEVLEELRPWFERTLEERIENVAAPNRFGRRRG